MNTGPVEPLPSVAAIIPAHNEAVHLGRVLSVLRGVSELCEIIVVDDGSDDDTSAVALRATRGDPRVRVVRHAINQGKGAALLTGARAARCPLLLFLDADLTGLEPQHIRALIQPVQTRRAEMALGLFRGGRMDTDLAHRATPWLTGQRCLPVHLFRRVSAASAAGYGVETAIALTARREGWRCRRIWLRGVSHPPSEFHRGLRRGIRTRAKMYADIFNAWCAEQGWKLLVPRSRRACGMLALTAALLASSAGYNRLMADSRLRLGDLPALPLTEFRRVLVIAPHPDDETLGAGGAIQIARAADADVRVVVVTNGDGQALAPLALEGRLVARAPDFIANGQRRQAETLEAARALGLSGDDVVFLGYPDGGLLRLWLDNWLTQCPLRARYTRVTHNPYPDTLRPQATYCGSDLLDELRGIVSDFQPDLVLLSHPNDEHPDHRAAGNFARLALALASEADPAYHPAVWGYLVHYGYYPQPRGLRPQETLLPPAPLSGEENSWARIDLTHEQIESKISALKAYRTQHRLLGSFLPSFARRNEIFADLILLDFSAVEFEAIPVREAGVLELPRLPEPASESARRRVMSSADLVGLRVGRVGDNLWLTADVRGPLIAGLRYRLIVKLPDGQTRTFTWPGDAVRSGRSTFTALLSLEALGQPPVLAFAAEIKQGATLDRTGWHFVILRDGLR